MRSLLLFWFFGALGLWASDAYPPPRFTQADRVRKLEAALPEIDQVFRRYGAERKIPGMVWGVVIDGKLAHVASSNTAYDADSVFRIASMTKSFTALAVLKLRDEGKLSLEDPVAKWIPGFARMQLPTRDSAPLRIRSLLSHSSGLPEDNPWGDQQLAASDADLTEWLRRGIPFSTAPGTRYEYSNFAFGLLGRIVTKASRVPYETYVQREILQKLGMASSTLEYASVPAAKRVKGFRLRPDGTYLEEAPLPHGVFGAMGGMLTSANDLGKYVAFHLSAWPPRDEPENGPVRRSSVREMAHLWTPANLTVRQGQATESGYGYGLRVSIDCRFEHMVGHGGGLPGFGSYMMWLPDYGVGLFAMANLTYVGPSAPISDALDLLQKSGGLQKRELPAAPILISMRDHIASLWKAWDDAEAKQIAAMNFFLDTPVPQRRAETQKLKDEVGQCSAPGPVMAENWLRGQFNMTCAKGTVGAFFTLAPTTPPKLQHLEFRKLASPSIRMGAPTGAPAGVSCSQ